MSGSWPSARTNIITQINGISATASGYEPETLTALEFPPSSNQESYPYAFVIPPARTIERYPGSYRLMRFDEVTVRVLVGALGDTAEAVSRRSEAWIEALANAFDDAVALDGNADILMAQSFSPLSVFPEGQGFDMALAIELSEVKEFGP